ncbi:hypothetical protein DAPK24_038280 [Pichia kluyveri]|uniref:Uncharacterized protein n=1 Tax=Pichia kluyveri TaxID=36015 RepID=A0AAV5R787_PICKL|nr:hypothetical protein DAPK24_038280 [Pichia kluyveri]
MIIISYSKDSKIIIVGSGVFGLSSALNSTKTGYSDLLRAKLTDIKRKLEIIRDSKKRNKVTSVFGTLDSIVRMIKADKACVKSRSKLIWYTDAINSDFIIDFIPEYKKLIAAMGVVSRVEDKGDSYTQLFRWKNPEDIVVDNYMDQGNPILKRN